MKKLLFTLIILCSLQGFGQTTGAKGVWRMNGNSNDASGNGNNGTDTNINYSQANGRLNQGAGFNGSSSGISVPSSMPDLSSFTISCWVRTTNTANQDIFHSRNTADNADCDFYTNLGKIGLVIWNGTAATRVESTISVNTGMWVYAVVTRTGNTANLYINGILNNTVTTLHTITIGSDVIWIGRHPAGVYFNGAIDELIVDNTIWFAARVKNEYARIKGFF